ncbi:hypothetical protein SteCoe_14587 [Stentor coeruleus]|uniref:UBC core domain-containing protein n=1 Tax=Stentor coeruleus TaxID=5963 RepID=A0A1R2C5K1_9CILI|nr:hypothetical protein SteCoe_14587 [Stentor coeruleus]
MSYRRIAKEFEYLEKNSISGLSLWQDDPSNPHNCTGQLTGPENTPYENGKFTFKIIFPLAYPFKPPKIFFVTKIYHPNILHNGDFCLGYQDGLLKENWSPSATIREILLYLIELLRTPCPDDPLEPDIASEYKKNKSKFNRNAREYTYLYAN